MSFSYYSEANTMQLSTDKFDNLPDISFYIQKDIFPQILNLKDPELFLQKQCKHQAGMQVHPCSHL
jgi:hypothetical protein